MTFLAAVIVPNTDQLSLSSFTLLSINLHNFQRARKQSPRGKPSVQNWFKNLLRMSIAQPLFKNTSFSQETNPQGFQGNQGVTWYPSNVRMFLIWQGYMTQVSTRIYPDIWLRGLDGGWHPSDILAVTVCLVFGIWLTWWGSWRGRAGRSSSPQSCKSHKQTWDCFNINVILCCVLIGKVFVKVWKCSKWNETISWNADSWSW